MDEYKEIDISELEDMTFTVKDDDTNYKVEQMRSKVNDDGTTDLILTTPEGKVFAFENLRPMGAHHCDASRLINEGVYLPMKRYTPSQVVKDIANRILKNHRNKP